MQKKLFICSNKFSFLLHCIAYHIMISTPRDPPAFPVTSVAIFSVYAQSFVPFSESLNRLVSLRVNDPTVASVAITPLSQDGLFFALVQQSTPHMEVTCENVVRWFTTTFPGADITFAVAPNARLPEEGVYRLLTLI